jgi:hypothetical protein
LIQILFIGATFLRQPVFRAVFYLGISKYYVCRAPLRCAELKTAAATVRQSLARVDRRSPMRIQNKTTSMPEADAIGPSEQLNGFLL